MPGPQFSTRVMNQVPILLIIILASPIAAQPNTVHVNINNSQANRNGSRAPDGLTIETAYQFVEAGVCKAQPNDTVLIQSGIYNETVTIAKPITLIASGGDAVIGQVIGKSHSTLKILTYNTHLFGDELAGIETFADNTRSRRIAEQIVSENADIVGLVEVWDEERKEAIDSIVNSDVFRYHLFYDNRTDELTDRLNSGLLLLSRHPIVNSDLIFYDDEEGCLPVFDFDCDGWASKGFVRATIVKEGFQIGIFLTHTEAGPNEADVRRKQLEQLQRAISKYRWDNPGSEVIVIGDFNIVGDVTSEYHDVMMPTVELRDSFRHAPCFDDKAAANVDLQYTARRDNELRQHFEGRSDLVNERLDYILYSHGTSFDVLPIKADVRRFRGPEPIRNNGDSSIDLSDHEGLVVEFSLFR